MIYRIAPARVGLLFLTFEAYLVTRNHSYPQFQVSDKKSRPDGRHKGCVTKVSGFVPLPGGISHIMIDLWWHISPFITAYHQKVYIVVPNGFIMYEVSVLFYPPLELFVEQPLPHNVRLPLRASCRGHRLRGRGTGCPPSTPSSRCRWQG